MNNKKLIQLWFLCFLVVSNTAKSTEHVSQFVGSVYDVKNIGANGSKQQNSRETTQAIQKAIDTCAAAGGGTVYVGSGDYVTGRLNLRSHVHFYIEAGATLYGSRDRGDWRGGRRAILYGEDLTNICIGGYGTVDGRGEQAQFPYTEKRDAEIQDRIDALERDKPDGMPFWKWTPPVYNIVYLRHCRDVTMTGVKLINSPIWCVHFLGCERVVVDGVYVYSSLIRGVNSDGINPNSCRDVSSGHTSRTCAGSAVFKTPSSTSSIHSGIFFCELLCSAETILQICLGMDGPLFECHSGYVFHHE